MTQNIINYNTKYLYILILSNLSKLKYTILSYTEGVSVQDLNFYTLIHFLHICLIRKILYNLFKRNLQNCQTPDLGLGQEG